MIPPIFLDFAMASSAVILGIVVMFKHMRVADDYTYTPPLELLLVCAGALSWAVYGFLALSAITSYPPLHTLGYQGHWGYTFARFLGFAGWILSLLLVSRYSAYMQVRKVSNKCSTNHKG